MSSKKQESAEEKELQKIRRLQENFHIIRKRGGALYYDTIRIGKYHDTRYVELQMVARRPHGHREFEVEIELLKNRTSTVQKRATARCRVTEIIKMLEMLHSESYYGKTKQTEVSVAYQQILEKALNRFRSLDTINDSTLTLRLKPSQAADIKEAGKRAGLRVSSKILLYCLAYFLKATSQPAQADPPE